MAKGVIYFFEVVNVKDGKRNSLVVALFFCLCGCAVFSDDGCDEVVVERLNSSAVQKAGERVGDFLKVCRVIKDGAAKEVLGKRHDFAKVEKRIRPECCRVFFKEKFKCSGGGLAPVVWDELEGVEFVCFLLVAVEVLALVEDGCAKGNRGSEFAGENAGCFAQAVFNRAAGANKGAQDAGGKAVGRFALGKEGRNRRYLWGSGFRNSRNAVFGKAPSLHNH